MRNRDILPVWGRILHGYRPFLSIEVTKECPLRCPGCYVYESGHLNSGGTVQALREYHGEELVERILTLTRQYRPLHISLVGGEPLLRHRELTHLIPQLNGMGIEVQVVTSAVRPIPPEWMEFQDLHIVVSVDGLAADHDLRRSPATYDRILRNIGPHQVIVHCTVIPQFLKRAEYLRDFVQTWSRQKNVRKIWFSLFTPQIGKYLPERLTPQERLIAVNRIDELRDAYPKLDISARVCDGFRHPPASPSECIFANITACLASDLLTPITPCQIGGRPECSECGCLAGAGLASIGRFKLAGLLKVSDIFFASKQFGEHFRKNRPNI